MISETPGVIPEAPARTVNIPHMGVLGGVSAALVTGALLWRRR